MSPSEGGDMRIKQFGSFCLLPALRLVHCHISQPKHSDLCGRRCDNPARAIWERKSGGRDRLWGVKFTTGEVAPTASKRSMLLYLCRLT
jgi:hypothetical protein